MTILVAVLLNSAKSRSVTFWISLMLFFDPGGFFAGYIGSDIFWKIKFYDIFFGLMLFTYFLKRESGIRQWRSHSYFVIIRYLLFISIYFLIMTGFLIPFINDYSNLPFFLQKNRSFFYAIPLFIMTYSFSLSSIKVFYRVLIVFSVIVLVSFMFTLLTPIKIIPFYTFSRYGEADRIIMISYGLIYWVLPMGMIALSLGGRFKIQSRNYLLITFVLMLITIFLTLTRREFMRIIFMVVVIPFLLSKINKTIYINKYIKFIFPALGIIFLLLVFFPKYIDLSVRLFNDTFHLVITGKDAQGIEDYRVTGSGDLTIAKDIIMKDPIFGMGYYPAQWSDVVEMKSEGDILGLALDASSEVPIYGALMRLGILGLIVPFLLYLYLYKIWINIFRTIRANFQKLINYPVELLIIIALLYFLLSKVTIDAFGLFGEFYSPDGLTGFVIMLGMWLGIFQRLKILLSSEKPVKINPIKENTI
jgi:hypothetical protein